MNAASTRTARQDSSPETDDYGIDEALYARDPQADNPGFHLDTTVILEVGFGHGDFRLCGCGCKEKVASSKRTFKQGHDQRLVGILTRAALRGDDVAVQSGGVLISGEALGMAAHLGLSQHGIAKLNKAVEAGQAKRDRKPATPKQNPTERGQVKIGRWFYSATRMGELVSYTDKQGEQHVANEKVAATFQPA
jgi:hypothetical protein